MHAVFEKAKAERVNIHGRTMQSFEPCSTLDADYWLLDEEMLTAGGCRRSPPATAKISVSMDGCGGNAVCPIRYKNPKLRRVHR